MPFFRLRQQLIYFAHVPKCAGTSVEAYLQRRFGALAFRDQFHYRDPGPRWTVTSPQHVTAADLERFERSHSRMDLRMEQFPSRSEVFGVQCSGLNPEH